MLYNTQDLHDTSHWSSAEVTPGAVFSSVQVWEGEQHWFGAGKAGARHQFCVLHIRAIASIDGKSRAASNLPTSYWKSHSWEWPSWCTSEQGVQVQSKEHLGKPPAICRNRSSTSHTCNVRMPQSWPRAGGHSGVQASTLIIFGAFFVAVTFNNINISLSYWMSNPSTGPSPQSKCHAMAFPLSI